MTWSNSSKALSFSAAGIARNSFNNSPYIIVSGPLAETIPLSRLHSILDGSKPARMKTLILVLLIASVVAFAGDTSIPQPKSKEGRGRYRLMRADVTVGLDNNGPAHSTVIKQLWKIDSTTGRTWHYNAVFRTTGNSEQWVETFDQARSKPSADPNHE
jgi:hypothetical protein